MEEVNDVQALEKISSEVDESQIKVILSSQCIKGKWKMAAVSFYRLKIIMQLLVRPSVC